MEKLAFLHQSPGSEVRGRPPASSAASARRSRFSFRGGGVCGAGTLCSPREDLVKSCPPLRICFTFHRSPTRTVTHLLVAHLAATTFPSTTPLNRQINAAIKSTHRLWWRPSKTACEAAAIKDLMKSDFGWDRKSAVAVREAETVADARQKQARTGPIR